MGRTFVTFEEASKLLKCTKRTVQNYVKRGLLRREYDEGVVLLREDVERLAQQNGVGLPALNNRTLLELLSRIRALEMQMAVVKKMHGAADVEPLRPEPEYALRLASEMEHYAKCELFIFAEVQLWASLFSRMDEMTFELMRQAGVKKDFWKDLFQLCLNLISYAFNKPEFMRLAMELEEDRKRLRSTILMWAELGHIQVSNNLQKVLGDAKTDLLGRLKANGPPSMG
jgi:hypothetical protein